MYIGEMIRRIRKEMQITQEQLAEGICSASTLSKIENGSQIPSRQTFEMLMERLGEPDCTYNGYTSIRELELYRLCGDVLEAMEFQELEQIEEKLWAIEHLVKQDNQREVQILELIQCLWMRMLLLPMQQMQETIVQQRFLQAFQLTQPQFDGWHTGENARINRVEMLLLNNIGVSYYEQQMYREALAIFLQLYQLHEKKMRYGKEYWKPKAGICGNLAICTLALKMFDEAMYYCNKGLYCARRDGNVMVCLNLLRSRAFACLGQKDMDGYYKNIFLARSFYEVRPNQCYPDVTFDDYMKYPKVLLVF